MTFSFKQCWSHVWQHLVVIVVFFLITVVYFSPEFFENKVLWQSDMVSSTGMGTDARQYHEATGEYAHWSNAMFGGMPHNVTYTMPSNNVFRYVMLTVYMGMPRHSAGLLWLLLLGGYIALLAFGLNPWQSMAGAIALAFCSYNPIIIGAGHVTKVQVLATLPVILAGVVLAFRGEKALGFILTLVGTGLNVYWNHQQISYYTILMLIPLAIAYLIEAIRHKRMVEYMQAIGVLLIAALLAIMPAIDKLIPTLDYSKETMRGGAVLTNSRDIKAEKTGLDRDYAFMWSYGIKETTTLLIPNFMGGSSHYPIGNKSQTYQLIKSRYGSREAGNFAESSPCYWGAQPFTSGPVYAGAIICFLFLLGLMVVKQPERWWLLAAVLIGIVLAWGKNFPWLNNLLFDYLPLYNKFRTPAMALTITTVAMAILAALAIKEVANRQVKAIHICIAAGIPMLICLIYALLPSIAGSFHGNVDAQLPDWLTKALIEDRKSLLRSDAWRSLLLIAASGIMMIVYIKKTTFQSQWFVTILAALIFIDLWTVDKHFLNNSHFVKQSESIVRPSDNDRRIMQDEDPDYRVLNLTTNTFNESQTSYFHKSIGGYSPAKLRRYQDIIDYYISDRINPNVINMLNTKYVITGNGVQQNPYAMGHAWIVNDITWVNNPNEEIEAIGNVDLHHTAIIDTCWKKTLNNITFGQDNNNTNNSVELISYDNPGHLIYESKTDNDGLIVFSEVYYKTWQATIDGVNQPLLRANYILRALPVTKGRHIIELKCVDQLFLTTHLYSLIASIIAVIALLIATAIIVYHHIKKN